MSPKQQRKRQPSCPLLAFVVAIATIICSSSCSDAFVPAAHPCSALHVCPTTTCINLASSDDYYSKWDNLVDEEDDDEDGDDKSNSSKTQKVPADMKYVLPNIKRQSDTFEALRSMDDPTLVSDVWLQSPADSMAWYVGQIARVSDVSPERAIDRQYPLIERHAWALRPVELHPQRGPFVVFFAPGNSVEDVVSGSQDPSVRLTRVEEEALDCGSSNVRAIEVGFRGAGYDPVEEDAHRVDMSNWEEEDNTSLDGEATSMVDDELRDFAMPATAEEDAAMQEKVDKLLVKDIDKFFDDPDFNAFMDSAFPKSKE